MDISLNGTFDYKVQTCILELMENHTSTQLIWEAFEWTANHRPVYMADIERRPNGSQWGTAEEGDNYQSWRKLAKLPWQQLPTAEYQKGLHQDKCLYFYLSEEAVKEHLPNAYQNFRLLDSFSPEELIEVYVFEKAHGVELVSPLVVAYEDVKTAWLILGPANTNDGIIVPDQLQVWTAYPGELTASIKQIKEFDGTLGSLRQIGLPVAVKNPPF
jgi:hypothetical protein